MPRQCVVVLLSLAIAVVPFVLRLAHTRVWLYALTSMCQCVCLLVGWRYILKSHGGRVPVEIKAVPEGSVVPYKNGEPDL